jgi:hypothetical protein
MPEGSKARYLEVCTTHCIGDATFWKSSPLRSDRNPFVGLYYSAFAATDSANDVHTERLLWLFQLLSPAAEVELVKVKQEIPVLLSLPSSITNRGKCPKYSIDLRMSTPQKMEVYDVY